MQADNEANYHVSSDHGGKRVLFYLQIASYVIKLLYCQVLVLIIWQNFLLASALNRRENGESATESISVKPSSDLFHKYLLRSDDVLGIADDTLAESSSTDRFPISLKSTTESTKVDGHVKHLLFFGK